MKSTGTFSLFVRSVHLSAVRIEGGAAASLAGEGPVQADHLIGGLVTDGHVE